MGDRPKIPPEIVADIVTACRRRCCLCFALRSDVGERAGQIAHLDHDPSNNAPDNLAFLCLDHREEYDSRTSQSKGLTIQELKRYRAELTAEMARRAPGPGSEGPRGPTQIAAAVYLGPGAVQISGPQAVNVRGPDAITIVGPAIHSPGSESGRSVAPGPSAGQYPPELGVDTLPMERVDARVSSPRDIAAFLNTVPPLSRGTVADEVYRGKWVTWRGTIASIQNRGYCLSALVETPDGAHVTLSFAPWERVHLEPYREGDGVAFEGQITKAHEGVELVRVRFSTGSPTTG